MALRQRTRGKRNRVVIIAHVEKDTAQSEKHSAERKHVPLLKKSPEHNHDNNNDEGVNNPEAVLKVLVYRLFNKADFGEQAQTGFL